MIVRSYPCTVVTKQETPAGHRLVLRPIEDLHHLLPDWLASLLQCGGFGVNVNAEEFAAVEMGEVFVIRLTGG